MKEKMIAIIGMGSAGAGAAAAINHTNPRADVAIIEKRDYETYSPCGMPFAFEGKLGFEDLKHDFPSKGPKNKLYLNVNETKIDVNEREVLIKTPQGREKVGYDSLILATGTSPIIPPITGIQRFLGSYAYTVNTLEEVSLLYERRRQTGKVVIIGGGAIGLEFALAMKKHSRKVIVAEMMDQVFPNAIDKDMARHVKEYLEGKGITLLTNSRVKELEGKDKIEKISIGEETYEANLVVLACGTVPNVELIKDTGILHNQKGIITNNRMMTNIEGVYAAGDCVETNNALTKRRCRSLLAVPAMKQGRVAGINGAGGRATYKGTLNTFISVLDEHAIGSTGLTEEQAKEEGLELLRQKVRGLNRPGWHPESKAVIIKLIADREGKLLGGQVFGEKLSVKSKIDVISAYIGRNSRLDDIVDGELSYCPDVAQIPDPLTSAAKLMLRRVRR